MAFSVIPGLNADDISIQLPAQGDKDWAINLRDLAFKKIAEHDHSGSGKGQPITATGLANDSIVGTKILLDNGQYLRWDNAAGTATNVIRLASDDKVEIAQQVDVLTLSNNTYLTSRNAADNADINLIKANASDNIELGSAVSVINLVNNTNLTSRNAADSANLNLIKANASDQAEIGIDVAKLNVVHDTAVTAKNAAGNADIDMVKVDAQDRVLVGSELYLKGSATLADNQSVAANVPNLPAASTDEFVHLIYKIVRDGSVEFGSVTFDEDGSNLVQKTTGDDVGVTFSNSSGTLQYTTTSTGNTAALSYVAIKA